MLIPIDRIHFDGETDFEKSIRKDEKPYNT